MTTRKILIVDDDQKVSRTLRRCLELTGNFEVREEHRGKQALSVARSFRPDLILLDVVMPDVDGGTIAAAIKEDSTLSDTPVIFLTATVSREEVGAKGNVVSGYTYLPKPIDPDVVVECIEERLAVAGK